MLQRSRAASRAECGHALPKLAETNRLQRSRAASRAECDTVQLRDRRGMRFNGAARLRARNAAPEPTRSSGADSFNGAARLRARNGAPPGSCGPQRAASTEPRGFARGMERRYREDYGQVQLQRSRAASRAECPRQRCDPGVRGRFNGAARLRARNATSSQSCAASSRSFNGAARLRARNVSGSTYGAVVMFASTEPRGFARGMWRRCR